MPASYYNRDGSGHSRRGQSARDNGATSWSQLPSALRRKLTSKQAEQLGISSEWHHAGKYANNVYVYYPEAVQAFWGVIDAAGITTEQALSAISYLPLDATEEETATWRARRVTIVDARNAAEAIAENM